MKWNISSKLTLNINSQSTHPCPRFFVEFRGYAPKRRDVKLFTISTNLRRCFTILKFTPFFTL